MMTVYCRSANAIAGFPAPPGPAARRKDRGRHRACDAVPGGKRRPIERFDKRCGGTQGALHPGDQVVDDGPVDEQLAVGEELHQDLAKQVILRRADCDGRRKPQPRAQIGEADLPLLRAARAR